MYLRKYKFSKAAFLENTSQQPSLYIIWFRVSPKRKYYFMSETYLKPSQTSKMKLLAKVVNASRDVFRTVFSIQNVFRTSKMELFTKIMNRWRLLTFSAKSPILDILFGPENASEFTILNFFHQKLHLRSLTGQICLFMYLVPQIWRWINENSKVCYESMLCVVSESSCSKNFVNFQEKHPCVIAFLNKVAGYMTLTGNVFLGNLWNFQNSFHKKHLRMRASAVSCRWKMFRLKDAF